MSLISETTFELVNKRLLCRLDVHSNKLLLIKLYNKYLTIFYSKTDVEI